MLAMASSSDVWTGLCPRCDGCDGRHIDDAAHRGRGCKNVHRLGRPEQDRADRDALSGHYLEGVERDVRGVQVWHDEQVRLGCEPRIWEDAAEDRSAQGRVRVHLAF